MTEWTMVSVAEEDLMDWLWLTLLVLVVIPLLIWGVINPRSLWWWLNGKAFRHPDKVEPSDSTHRFMQVLFLVLLLFFVVGGILIFNAWRGDQRTTDCEEELLPQVQALEGLPTESKMRQIAEENGLDLEVYDPLTGLEHAADISSVTSFELYDGNRHVLTARDSSGIGLPLVECE